MSAWRGGNSFPGSDGVFTSPLAADRVMKYKLINDPIHGHIKMFDYMLEIVDTPEFQRLRDLNQLGSSYFVFPGATHKRFEHSIGTSHLAHAMITHFRDHQPELEISEKDIALVTIAGLAHDLGHGPFSHVFDSEFLKRAKPELHWKHEQGSVDLLSYLIDQNNIDIEKHDLSFIGDVIQGNMPKRPADSERPLYFYQIVSNPINSIDVDKFDYLSRDAQYTGIRASYDHSRLLNYSRVIGDDICFHHKESYNIYEFFHTRYSMFKQVYSHSVAKAIDFMITDVFMEADPVLGLSSAVLDMERFARLGDHVLYDVQASSDPDLVKARNILLRLRKRQLYKLADERVLSMDQVKRIRIPTENDIATHASSQFPLDSEDIIVHELRMNYAMKEHNPVDFCKFFSSWSSEETHHLAKDKVSMLVPERFQEEVLQIYVRDANKVEAAARAFRSWWNKINRSLAASPYDSSHHSRGPILRKRRRTRSNQNLLRSLSQPDPVWDDDVASSGDDDPCAARGREVAEVNAFVNRLVNAKADPRLESIRK